MSQYNGYEDSPPLLSGLLSEIRSRPTRMEEYKGNRRRGSRFDARQRRIAPPPPPSFFNQENKVLWADSQENHLASGRAQYEGERDGQKYYVVRRERSDDHVVRQGQTAPRSRDDRQNRMEEEERTRVGVLENRGLGLATTSRNVFETNDKREVEGDYYPLYGPSKISETFVHRRVPQRIDRMRGHDVDGIEWSVFQNSLMPLVEKLVETNNLLSDVLLRGLSFDQNPSSKGKDREDNAPHDTFNIDLEKGKDSEFAEYHPVMDFDEGAYDSKYEDDPMRYGEEGYAQFLKKSGITNVTSTSPAIDTFSSPGCQWLVPYGTFLAPGTHRVSSVLGDRNRRASAESQNDYDSRTPSTERTERTERTGSLIKFYSTVFLSSEYLAQIDIENERRSRMNIVRDAHLTPWEFCATRHILDLYPLRYNMRKTIPNGAIDDQNLAGLCEEVRYNLQATIVPSWQHLTTLIPLIEERLLCATGDPELRLDACWDRRPRGTFLDFGWTRKKPDMPKEWSFFAHCKPETLISLLIEVIEAVEDASTGLVEEWFHRANHQAWYTISLGTILERCYARRLLIQPQPENISKYRKHILYVLAATELMNTCFKSRQVKSLADFSVGRLECDNVEDLLRTPLSEISNALLCHSWSRPLYALGSGVFLPSNLKIPMLTRIGGINVDWTEYMQEHLTFDPETMTVYVYWFFSHISDNASWHLYCERYGCDTRHSGSPRPTYTGDLKYREEVLQSYRWLFSASPAEALEQLCDLPLPWWLVPLEEDDVILPWHRSGAWIEDQAAVKIRKSKWNKLMSRATRVFSKQREKQNKRPSVRSLLKNSANQKCELPIDCKELLDFLDREDDETTGTLPFARFPELGPRVKILMEFMEKQKPRGFFALWRDKRDSSSWYTFWAAVLLGVAAFILALAGLGLASAQTWASFKALDLQTDSSPTPGPSR